MVTLDHYEMLSAKYFVGQILEDYREVLAYSVRRGWVILILKDPFKKDCHPISKELSDRYDVYGLPLDKMKPDTDLLKAFDCELHVGKGDYPPNDPDAARHAFDVWLKEQQA